MKKANLLIILLLSMTTLCACMGRNAMSKSIQDFNLESADGRWGREGMFLLTWPVAYVTGFLDLFIVNSIEFWSGSNPVSDKPAITSIPFNGDEGQTAAPVAQAQTTMVDLKTDNLESLGITHIASAKARYLENEVLMYVVYEDGSQEVFYALRDGGVYSFYRGKELMLRINESELKDWQAMLKGRMESIARLATSPLRG